MSDRLTHQFVETVPERDNMKDATLYLCLQYDTTAHLCACGCGREVTLPLDPLQWKIQYDGRTASLSPSVGNWSFPCRSHYWITHNRVLWAWPFSDEEIQGPTARRPGNLFRPLRHAGLRPLRDHQPCWPTPGPLVPAPVERTEAALDGME